MSTIRANTYANGDGTKSVGADYVVEGTAKAWANLNGAGTIALRDSFNVSSVTDNGTGNYTKTLTNSMNNANYSVSIARNGTGNSGEHYYSETLNQTTSAFQRTNGFASSGGAHSMADASVVSSSVFGDLA